MEKCTIYYAMREYECCRKGFGNGYPVKWLASKEGAQALGFNIGEIDYRYQGA